MKWKVYSGKKYIKHNLKPKTSVGWTHYVKAEQYYKDDHVRESSW